MNLIVNVSWQHNTFLSDKFISCPGCEKTPDLLNRSFYYSLFLSATSAGSDYAKWNNSSNIKMMNDE